MLGAGLRPDIQLRGSHGHLDGIEGLGFHGALLPMGIQSHLIGSLGQLCDLGTALGLCKPAQEGVARPGSGAVELHGQIHIVALHRAAHIAAVAVVTYIAIVFPLSSCVVAIDVHIRLDQPAAHQSRQEVAACIAGQGDGSHELVTHIPFQDGHGNRLIFHSQPAGAFVVCKANQRIKLMLVQGDAPALHVLIDLAGHAA